MNGKKAMAFAMAGIMTLGMCTPVLAEEEKTVHALITWNENTDGGKVLRGLSDEYTKEHPNFKVEIETIAQNDIDQKLSVLAASNDMPELFVLTATSYTDTFAQQGFLKNVDEFLAETENTDILPENARTGHINLNQGSQDNLWCLPTELNIEGIWYNKRIFEENGLTVPETIEDLEAVAQTLLDAGIQPFAMAGKEEWPLSRLAGAYINTKEGVQALIQANHGELSWENDSFLEAYTWLRSCAEAGWFGEGFTTIDANTAEAMFLTGQTAMIYDGSWLTQKLDGEDNTQGEDIGFFGMPVAKDGKGAQNDYVQNYGLVWAINADKYDDQVKDWLGYVFGNYGDYCLENTGKFTPFTTNEEHQLGYYAQLVSDAMADAGEAAVWPEYMLSAETMDMYLNDIQLVALGEMTPEDFLKEIQEAVEAEK